MNKNNNKMDLLGNAPVPQALMALGIPIMIGMLINALYNLVDAYFIGGLGESQMGAISIAFPLGQVVIFFFFIFFFFVFIFLIYILKSWVFVPMLF